MPIHRKKPFSNNSKSFITWEDCQFPADFVKRYLEEILTRGVLRKEEKRQIEKRGTGFFLSVRERINHLIQYFPALFYVDSTESIQNMEQPLNPSDQKLNEEIRERLARHVPPILPLGDFIHQMREMVSDEEWTVHLVNGQWAVTPNDANESYSLLPCYAEIYTFSSDTSKEKISLVLKKAIETGQVGLGMWCIDRLRDIGFHFNAPHKKWCQVLDVAFDGLENRPLQTFNEREWLYLENAEKIVRYLILAGAVHSKNSRLRAMFGFLVNLEPRFREQLEKNDEGLIDREALEHRVQGLIASFFSTLLLLNPDLSMTSKKRISKQDTYLNRIVGALLTEVSDFDDGITRFLKYDSAVFQLKLFYPGERYYKHPNSEEQKQRLASCLISPGFFQAILDGFLPSYMEYQRLNPGKNSLRNHPIVSQLLDWLSEQAQSSSLLTSCMDVRMGLASSKKENELEACWKFLLQECERPETNVNPAILTLIPPVTTLVIGLLKAGIGLSYVDKRGMTLLHKAAQQRWPVLADLLLELKLDVNDKTRTGRTALHLAITQDFFPSDRMLLELLVRSGCDLTQQDNHGWAPLHLLVKFEKVELLKYILKVSLDKKHDLKLHAKTSWRMHAPWQERTLEKIIRFGVFLKEKKYWGSHQKTAIQLAEELQLSHARDLLLNYQKAYRTNAWSLETPVKKKAHLEEASKVSLDNHASKKEPVGAFEIEITDDELSDKDKEQPLPTPRYEAILPDKEETTSFTEITIEANGDCAFLALGVTRDEVYKTLMAIASIVDKRKELADEIRSAIIGRMIGESGLGDFLRNNEALYQEGKELYDDYHLRAAKLDEYLGLQDNERILTYQDNHPDIEEKDIPKLSREEWDDYFTSNPDLSEEYETKKQARTKSWNKLVAYAERKDVYKDYVSAIKKAKKMYLGIGSILLYAKEVNLSVYIWRKGDKTRGEADLVLAFENSYYEAENPSRTVHLLQTGKYYDHFNRLESQLEQVLLKNEEEKQEKAEELKIPSPPKIVITETEEGIHFSIQKSANRPDIDELNAVIHQISVKRANTTAIENFQNFQKEATALEQVLKNLCENQAEQSEDIQKIRVDLQHIQWLLKDSLAISARYEKEVNPYPLRRVYYERLRAELAVNFTAVLLLATKLMAPREGKLDDAVASRSKLAGILNMTALGSEILEPLVEGATFLAENGETVVSFILEAVKISAEMAGSAAHAIPYAGSAIGTGIKILGGAARLAEFCGDLMKLEDAHHALLDLTPKDVEQYVEKIALLMTDRVKGVLDFLTVEGVQQLAFFDFRRLLMGLLKGEFKASAPIETVIDILCRYKAKQGRLLFRIPLTGKVNLRKDEILKWLSSSYDVEVPASKIPDDIDENWLHHGPHVAIKKLCRQQKIAIPNKEQKEEIIIIEETKKEAPKVMPAPKVKHHQTLSNVKKIVDEKNHYSKLLEKNESLEIEVSGLRRTILKVQEENKKVLKKNKILKEQINAHTNALGEQNEKITALEQKIDKINNQNYSNGLENYKLGNQYYARSQDETVTLEDRRIYWLSAQSFFSKAKKTLQKLDLSLLSQEDSVNASHLIESCERNLDTELSKPSIFVSITSHKEPGHTNALESRSP